MFCFYGFLPKKGYKRILEEIRTRNETAIIYEGPHRIEKTLKRIDEVMPDKEVVVARELTKKFEEFAGKDIKAKGEFIILIGK